MTLRPYRGTGWCGSFGGTLPVKVWREFQKPPHLPVRLSSGLAHLWTGSHPGKVRPLFPRV